MKKFLPLLAFAFIASFPVNANSTWTYITDNTKGTSTLDVIFDIMKE